MINLEYNDVIQCVTIQLNLILTLKKYLDLFK